MIELIHITNILTFEMFDRDFNYEKNWDKFKTNLKNFNKHEERIYF